MGKPEGKRHFRRPGHRWEDNIKINLQEIGCESVEQLDLVQYIHKWSAVVNAVMNVLVS